jgi:hypothetical protein
MAPIKCGGGEGSSEYFKFALTTVDITFLLEDFGKPVKKWIAACRLQMKHTA